MTGAYYNLAELSERAEVPERTVRYYIQKRLIPGPLGRGRKSRYNDDHLDRLREIRQLRALGIPLDIIEVHMEEYEPGSPMAPASGAPPSDRPLDEPPTSDPDLPELPPQRGVFAGTMPACGPEGPSRASAALDYIARARMAASTAAEMPAAMGAARLPIPGRTPREPSPGVGRKSRWERIGVTPDIEIHVKSSLPRSQKRALEQLLEKAKELFGEESS
jgi:DNA-binding transcriptional MerR regulator